MQKEQIRKIARAEAIKAFIREYGLRYVPAAVSNRHVHLSAGDIARLFGEGSELTPIKALSQPGQFVCAEKVALAGPKGTLPGVRVLGPARKHTQVEISVTDSFALGIKPVVRMSGELDDTSGGRLIGPKGVVELARGVIVSARHLHVSEEEAAWYGVADGDTVSVKKTGAREITFNGVVVRAGKNHSLELHLDTDEANAAGIKNGELLLLEKDGGRNN